MSLERKIILCSCHSIEHQVVFVKFDDEPETVYMEVHLTTYRNFWKRLWVGIKYAFGRKSNYGAWDEFIFEKENLKEMQTFLTNELKS